MRGRTEGKFLMEKKAPETSAHCYGSHPAAALGGTKATRPWQVLPLPRQVQCVALPSRHPPCWELCSGCLCSWCVDIPACPSYSLHATWDGQDRSSQHCFAAGLRNKTYWGDSYQKLPPPEPATTEINVPSKRRGHVFTYIPVMFEDLGFCRVLIMPGEIKNKAHLLVYAYCRLFGWDVKTSVLEFI